MVSSDTAGVRSEAKDTVPGEPVKSFGDGGWLRSSDDMLSSNVNILVLENEKV